MDASIKAVYDVVFKKCWGCPWHNETLQGILPYGELLPPLDGELAGYAKDGEDYCEYCQRRYDCPKVKSV